MPAKTAARQGSDPRARFGTFTGVFTPNVLTILGIILFLRTGQVVGQAGLYHALGIVVIANVISLLTGLSLSAIATSMRVRAGGNYYIISRTLGLEIGGAIGIPLYLSQAISVAFYIIGFTEALAQVAPQIPFQATATLVVVLFAILAYVGADIALKIQFGVLAVLVAALISFFTGHRVEGYAGPVLTSAYTVGWTFWALFALFFPAVCGVESGTSLSGDLKDPATSIPRGTIASILVTATVYLLAVYWHATHATRAMLVDETNAMQAISSVPSLILAGVFAATLSSALGSVLAAPRTLQALANDEVLPRWLAHRMGSETEPRAAVLVTGTIAICVIWLGDLNFVAPIISMFFLNTYGMTNLVAGIERLIRNPSFRPRFNIPWLISILGAAGCYGAMFLINPVATILAIVISYGIYVHLARREMQRTWGDVRSGIWFTLTRRLLFNLRRHADDTRNWRPNLLVFTGQPATRQALAEMADWLSTGRGLVTFFQFLVGDPERLLNGNLKDGAEQHIREYIERHGMTAFAEAVIVPDFHAGALTVAQAHGVSGLGANGVLMGYSGTAEGWRKQLALVRDLALLRKSVMVLKHDPERGWGERRHIDVWWGGRGPNADLMLLLAHLIDQHPFWEDASIRLMRVIADPAGREQACDHLAALAQRLRVEAEPVILVPAEAGRPLSEVVADVGRTADLTLLGLPLLAPGEIDEGGPRLAALIGSVSSVLLVRSGRSEGGLLEQY